MTKEEDEQNSLRGTLQDQSTSLELDGSGKSAGCDLTHIGRSVSGRRRYEATKPRDLGLRPSACPSRGDKVSRKHNRDKKMERTGGKKREKNSAGLRQTLTGGPIRGGDFVIGISGRRKRG